MVSLQPTFCVGVLTASVATLLTFLLVRGVIVNSKSQRRKIRKIRDQGAKYIDADEDVIKRFSEAIQCETVSWSTEKISPEELLKLHALIKQAFPTVHSSPLVKCEVINNYSLLFTVTGSDPSLKPYLLISHLDVVPVTDQKWDVPPFDGLIKDGFIWGRGTLDVKNGVMGSLEALEFLLKDGFQPKRGFFLSFGHDEEVHGNHGAAEIAKEFRSRGVKLEFIQDEGLMIMNGLLPGVSKHVAGIGVAEKGNLQIKLIVESSAGHGSMPPRESSIGILANAIARIEANPMPSAFGRGPEEDLLKQLSCEMRFPMRFVLCNLWLFRPIVSRLLSRSVAMNALMRTTIAITTITGGTKTNVIPASAMATLDIRVHPGDTTEFVISHLRSCIKDDRVQIKIVSKQPPSPIASSEADSFSYNTIVSSILDVFPDVVVAPGLLIANTDSKHFVDITPNVYRFMPSVLGKDDVRMIHGANERISIKNYEQTINFYYRLMINADEASL